jgi:hypothetical protein
LDVDDGVGEARHAVQFRVIAAGFKQFLAEQRELSPFTVKRQAPFSQAKRYAVGWNADALNAGRNARAT